MRIDPGGYQIAVRADENVLGAALAAGIRLPHSCRAGRCASCKSKLVAVNVFLPQIGDFDAMNRIYDAWVDPERLPARACVEARLADPDLRIEVTAVAAV